jgi:hypothetical protein
MVEPMEPNVEKTKIERNRLIRLLYPDHSPFETALWISGWSFGVGYSIYNCYMASQG